MAYSTTKACSRCHQDFVCNPSDIAACQCSQVSFTEKEKDFIKTLNYDDCLCLDCLKALKTMASSDS